MKGLELSRAFFEEFGRPMLEEQFSDVLPFLAAGLFGSGSECFGYDDAVSQDHDFEPGFCVFLPEESLIDRRTAFLLERAYTRLPRDYQGFHRPVMQPVGGARRGVFRTEAFFEKAIGSSNGALTLQQWFSVPEQALAEATNGELYFDHFGEVSRIREVLSYYPEDVRLKKLAGHLLLMGQTGQYNYSRCLKHGESAAAQLAVGEFVKSAMAAVFLLNRRYQPFYKWCFRALRELPVLSELSSPLEMLLSTGNDSIQANEKMETIERISSSVMEELTKQGLSGVGGTELERLAYEVNAHIADSDLRNQHVLFAV